MWIVTSIVYENNCDTTAKIENALFVKKEDAEKMITKLRASAIVQSIMSNDFNTPSGCFIKDIDTFRRLFYGNPTDINISIQQHRRGVLEAFTMYICDSFSSKDIGILFCTSCGEKYHTVSRNVFELKECKVNDKFSYSFLF